METTEPKRDNVIELRPCIGVVVGTERNAEPETIIWDQDEIWCNGKRIGHVSHAAGAIPRILRVLNDRTKASILADIQKLRSQSGWPPCGNAVNCLPDPKAIKRVLTSARRSK